MLQVVTLHIGVSGFMLDYRCVHCAYVPRIKIHFGFILILNHWRGSPAVGEWCGKVLQIKEMIALNIVSLRILYSLWHYHDSIILAYGYELVLT